jgi:hypothetical protein
MSPLLVLMLQKDDAAKSSIEGVRGKSLETGGKAAVAGWVGASSENRGRGGGCQGGDGAHDGEDACGAGEAASRLVEREGRDRWQGRGEAPCEALASPSRKHCQRHGRVGVSPRAAVVARSDGRTAFVHPFLVRCSFFGGQGRRWTRKEKVVVVLLLFPSDLLFPGDGLIDDLLPPIGDPTGDDRGWKAPPVTCSPWCCPALPVSSPRSLRCCWCWA